MATEVLLPATLQTIAILVVIMNIIINSAFSRAVSKTGFKTKWQTLNKGTSQGFHLI